MTTNLILERTKNSRALRKWMACIYFPVIRKLTGGLVRAGADYHF
jgi:hypothetical protein